MGNTARKHEQGNIEMTPAMIELVKCSRAQVKADRSCLEPISVLLEDDFDDDSIMTEKSE